MKKYILVFCFVTFSNLMYGQADYGFTLKGGVNFPAGDFAKFYNSGFGGFGGVFYNLRPSTRFSFTVGYNSWSLDLDALNEELKNSGNTGRYDVEAPVKTVPIFILSAINCLSSFSVNRPLSKTGTVGSSNSSA